jgi:hypothetical protein
MLFTALRTCDGKPDNQLFLHGHPPGGIEIRRFSKQCHEGALIITECFALQSLSPYDDKMPPAKLDAFDERKFPVRVGDLLNGSIAGYLGRLT